MGLKHVGNTISIVLLELTIPVSLLNALSVSRGGAAGCLPV